MFQFDSFVSRTPKRVLFHLVIALIALISFESVLCKAPDPVSTLEGMMKSASVATSERPKNAVGTRSAGQSKDQTSKPVVDKLNGSRILSRMSDLVLPEGLLSSFTSSNIRFSSKDQPFVQPEKLVKDHQSSDTHQNTIQVTEEGLGAFPNGVVAAEHPRCSEVGVNVIRRGGSAVDATIASLLCIGVINNYSSGIGGGGVMLVRASDGSQRVIDFRETAPASSTMDMFTRIPDAQSEKWATDSTLSVGVPGEIRGFAVAHKLYGRLPWSDLFTESIQIARDGFTVTAKLESMIQRNEERLRKDRGMLETYFDAKGARKRQGDMIFRPNLARTLESIAADGEAVFYKSDGWIMKSIVQTVQKRRPAQVQTAGLTESDMSEYRVRLRTPLETTMKLDNNLNDSYRIITTGAPTSGPLLIQMLHVLRLLFRKYDLTQDRAVHFIVETIKFAFGSRMRLGDPDVVPNMDETVRQIISDSHIQSIVDRIVGHKSFDTKYYLDGEFADIHSEGTTSVSTYSKHRDEMGDWQWQIVSCTSTVNLEWGSGIMDEQTGIILNNQMDDFSLPNLPNYFGLIPSKANYIASRKRPLSSAIPVIVERNGQPIMSMGGSGGSRIISSVLQSLVNVLMFKMHPAAAVEHCRVHHQLLPNRVMVEDRCGIDVVNQLQEAGHSVEILGPEAFCTSVNLVMAVDPPEQRHPVTRIEQWNQDRDVAPGEVDQSHEDVRRWIGWADHRKQSQAAGF